MRQAFRPLHAVLNIAGIIPGPVGMLASLAQAGLYGLEGNSALAAHYLSQSLMIGLAGPVGGAVLGALSKMGPAAKVILGTVLGAQSLYTAGVAGINLYNSASTIADGLLNGDMSWLDAFCEGSMALNSAAGIYYSLKGLVNSCELTLKGLDDVAAKYAAKQEAWYKEHAGYTTENFETVTESGGAALPKTINTGGSKTYYYHSCGDDVADIIAENGFRTDIPNPQAAFNNNRYGRGVYLADSPTTALAERPGGTVLKVNATIGKNLDLRSRGVIGGDDYTMTHAIARGARKHGYDSISFISSKNPSGINTVVFNPSNVSVEEIMRK